MVFLFFSIQVLSDSSKKQEYDTFGMGGAQANRGGGFRAQQGFSGLYRQIKLDLTEYYLLIFVNNNLRRWKHSQK